MCGATVPKKLRQARNSAALLLIINICTHQIIISGQICVQSVGWRHQVLSEAKLGAHDSSDQAFLRSLRAKVYSEYWIGKKQSQRQVPLIADVRRHTNWSRQSLATDHQSYWYVTTSFSNHLVNWSSERIAEIQIETFADFADQGFIGGFTQF